MKCKAVNLRSLCDLFSDFTVETFKEYTNLMGVCVKIEEVADICKLVSVLTDAGCAANDLDAFYVGYAIPQIGKEFDLLKFFGEYILNIEIKSVSTPEKILKQLIRNRSYLNSLGLEVKCYAFISSSSELYSLSDTGELVEGNLEALVSELKGEEVHCIEDLDGMFDPSSYLVSPLNSTDKFLRGEYFLNHQQEEEEGAILKLFADKKSFGFVALTGAAGTGKTLLAYHLVKKVQDQGGKAVVIHVGNLNAGHVALNERGWDIYPIKSIGRVDFSKYEMIVVDEAQRLLPRQADFFDLIMKKHSIGCVLSFDKKQTLNKGEADFDLSAFVEAKGCLRFVRLSEKIRTNKNVASFIKCLFDASSAVNGVVSDAVQLRYFSRPVDAKSFISSLHETKWKYLRYTPSQRSSENHQYYATGFAEAAHQVIGQEFDSVAVAIDPEFYYAGDGELLYRSFSYYDSPKMLFQNMTRARKELMVIIVNNPVVLARCMKVLKSRR